MSSEIKYRPDIDGLRAIAVCSVVLYHAFPGALPGGFTGVDIFFVISGFLITGILLRENETGTFSILRFYKRRVLRIFPALAAVLIACLLFGWIGLFALEYAQLGRHVAAGVGFLSNLLLFREVGYFDAASEVKPLIHLWSLAVEEQYYIGWPLLLWLALLVRRKWLLPLLVLALLLASLWISVRVTVSHPSAAFYLPVTRCWELLAGSLLAIASGSTKPLRRWTSEALAVVGLALIVAGFVFVDKTMPFPGKLALLPVVGTVLLILTGANSTIGRALSNRVVVFVGLISFPLYLWHWPLLSFARIVESETPQPEIRALLVIIAVLLAAGTYYLIERPFRFGKLKAVGVPVLVSTMILIGGAGLAVNATAGLPSRSANAVGEVVYSQFVGPMWAYTRNDLCDKRHTLDTSGYLWWFCMANKEGPADVLIIGNSYANQLYPGFASVEPFASQTVVSIGACDPRWYIPDEGTRGPGPCTGARPFDQMNMINDLIARERPKMVVMSGLTKTPDQVYIDALMKRIAYIEALGSQVVLFSPYVAFERDVRTCFPRPFAEAKSDCTIPVEKHKKLLEDFSPLVKAVSTAHPNVLIFDANSFFCSETVCSMKQGDKPLLRDEYDHWSEFASIGTVQIFADWLKTKQGSASASLH